MRITPRLPSLILLSLILLGGIVYAAPWLNLITLWWMSFLTAFQDDASNIGVDASSLHTRVNDTYLASPVDTFNYIRGKTLLGWDTVVVTAAGNIWVWVGSPNIKLDVAGWIRAWSQTAVITCDATNEWVQRYNYSTHTTEYCNASAWTAWSSTPCAPGTYSATGYPTCTSTSAGYYTAYMGSVSQTACGSAALYQPSTWQSSCLSASPGYYTTWWSDATNRTAQTQCEANNWCSGWIKTACIWGGLSPAGSTSANACSTPALYTFTTHTFTSCNMSYGPSWPSLTSCRNAYNATEVNAWKNTYLNMTTNGFQLWTVPIDWTYSIDAYGGHGGSTSTNWWKWARVKWDFFLTWWTVLVIAVGQQWDDGNTDPGTDLEWAGGGGGTFVATSDNIALVVAAGWAGAAEARIWTAGQGWNSAQATWSDGWTQFVARNLTGLNSCYWGMCTSGGFGYANSADDSTGPAGGYSTGAPALSWINLSATNTIRTNNQNTGASGYVIITKL